MTETYSVLLKPVIMAKAESSHSTTNYMGYFQLTLFSLLIIYSTLQCTGKVTEWKFLMAT